MKYKASALLTQCGRFSWYLIKYQVLHVIKLTDQSNLQTYYLKTDAKIAFFAPRRKILLRKHEKQVCKRLRKKSGMPRFLQCAFPNAGIKRESVGKQN